MFTGRIGKAKDLPGYWWAECDDFYACTQGTSREDALVMLADCIECLANCGMTVTVTETGPTDGDEIAVVISSDKPDALAALSLRQQS